MKKINGYFLENKIIKKKFCMDEELKISKIDFLFKFLIISILYFTFEKNLNKLI